MTNPGKSVVDGLFLEDLRVGQRFSSGAHTIDAAQIKAFASQFDPQPFHAMAKPPSQRCSADWRRAAGIPLRSR
jgi:hypothetical protein